MGHTDTTQNGVGSDSPLPKDSCKANATLQAGPGQAVAPGQPNSPFARASYEGQANGNWQIVKDHVQRHVALSQAFSTLRDMDKSAVIHPEQLKPMKLLGQGAFATVEQALYSPSGGGKPYIVAVKRLKMELFRNQEDLNMFVQEVELMRKLRHRNIVQFIGAGEVRPGEGLGDFACEFVVQEYMAGGSLKQLVTRQMLSNGGTIYTNSDALDICLQMARGLRYLHKARPMVIHRDLKLENVLLGSRTALDGHFVVKLADFGLSRRVQAKQQAIHLRKATSGVNLCRTPQGKPASSRGTPLTRLRASSGAADGLEDAWNLRVSSTTIAARPGLMRSSQSSTEPGAPSYAGGLPEEVAAFRLTGRTGSLMYMAPEVFNEQPYAETADVFSFGVMMYEVMQRYIMLSAVSVRGTYEELEAYCARVAAGYRPPLHTKWPPSLAKLITDCWAQNPSARPSMDEVVTRLEAIQASGQVAALDHANPCCGCTIC